MVVSGKRELIEAFIDQKMQLLGPDDDVRVAFRTFWEEERTKAYAGLIEQENLDPIAFKTLHRDILFSGKQPLADEVGEGELRVELCSWQQLQHRHS
ncbi:type I restriction endonuclease subunit R, EcoR124 family [Pseudogemmobacter bohemicus]|uniref:type I restriction endonuclease subunit R, EcoR124 family n=1 Tax=Pseudogemmobacter bohemicus TaxID=2250708 RepID=UPI001E35B0CF|nr:hypothetical protein [Pseudogemmobacter bohemicus]